MLNPYHGLSLGEFLLLFMQRLIAFFTGHLSFHELASDEIQVLVLMGVAISSALVGTFLVLRRMTMLANSLSHTILMGIVLAYFFSQSSSADAIAPMHAMLLASLLTGFLTAFLTEFLTKEDVCKKMQAPGLSLPVFLL